MLKLRFTLDGEERTVPLAGPEVRLGRSGENEVVLPDYSVSRRHAVLRRDGDAWHVYDLKSTNGVQLNHVPVERAPIRVGDRLKVGVFELVVDGRSDSPSHPGLLAEHQASAAGLSPPPAPPSRTAGRSSAGRTPMPPPVAKGGNVSVLQQSDSAISNATIVRSLSEFTAAYGLDEAGSRRDRERASLDSTGVRSNKRKALDQAYGSTVFGLLMRLGRLLITTESPDEILAHVMDIAFEVLPVDRGFILLRDEDSGEAVCEMVRIGDRVEFRPQSEVPISRTMLEAVMSEKVALLTYDALSDRRLAGTESVRIHQIRAAMCAPLWSGEKIIGVIQVDTPHHTGSFTEQDIDLLTALANYGAVAIERVRNAKKAEFERQVRGRLERYHSPSVIEEVLQQGTAVEEGVRRLRRADVTVLFADIVGFTGFSENSDPEMVAELMEGYFTHAVEAIFSAGGTLDKFIGDCVMAFFGAPVPQEDHALRAVEAAMRISEALDDWNADRASRDLPQIATRIGINSGPVVVGDIGSNRRVDYTVLGNTVNVAARLEEAVAKPGDIVLGAETYRLIDGRIATESLGEIPLKGLSRNISVYRVVRRPAA